MLLLSCDEAYFHLSGCQLHERPLCSDKVTVWCAISANGVISPHFSEDDNGVSVTITSNGFVGMLRPFFEPRRIFRMTKIW